MGCSLLVRLYDSTNPDPAKNARGCYRRGDIVEVRPLSSVWGAEERPPRFCRINLNGSFSVEKVAKYIAEEHDTADGLPGAGSARVRRRLYRIDLNALSASLLNLLQTDTGTINVRASGGNTTWTAFRFFVVNKKDGSNEGAKSVTEADLA